MSRTGEVHLYTDACLFIYLGFLCHFQHCIGHTTTGIWKPEKSVHTVGQGSVL